MTSAATLRGLQTASTSEGVLAILAIDHRDSLRVELNPDDPDSVSAQDITDFKDDVITELAPYASAVMLESEYSLPQAIIGESMPGSVGFLAALEAQGYMSDPGAGPTTFLEDFSAADAKRIGASAAKLLLHYNPAHAEHAAAQRAVVTQAVADCAEVGLPLFLEPMFYDLADPADQRVQVIGAVRDLGPLGADVLKLPFPVHPTIDDLDEWVSACDEIEELSPAPWALLSAGVPFALYLRQLRCAVGSGCSGFMAGRALWREALEANPEDRVRVLREECRPKFLQLLAAVSRSQRSWDQPIEDTDPDPDLLRWFGVRSFVVHEDVDRLEERVVLQQAPSAELAIESGSAEAAEYAAAYNSEVLDLVQAYEIAMEQVIEADGSLVDGVEVFSQMRPIKGSPQAMLEAFIDAG